MIGCKLNVHCPFTEVINGTVCTVGTCPTADTTMGALAEFSTGVTVALVSEGILHGTSGDVTVFTMLL
jgi:hypothetical protein